LLIAYQYNKLTIEKANPNKSISESETKNLETKLQKLLTTEQFAEYQKRIAKIL